MVKVIVQDETHGTFTVDGDAFERMFESIVTDVNIGYGGTTALAAYISEATGINYFDAGLTLIVAVLVDFGWTREATANFMAADNDVWATNVREMFTGA